MDRTTNRLSALGANVLKNIKPICAKICIIVGKKSSLILSLIRMKNENILNAQPTS